MTGAAGPGRLESAGLSHVGRVRAVNEDAWLARPELGLWAVADGMGGHERGDVASRMVVDGLGRLPVPRDARAFRAAVEAALERVNRALLPREPGGPLSGSTVAALLVHGRHYAALWAGDSRLYRVRGGALEPLTRDHSLVQELVDRGELAPEAAPAHPLASRITRAVGVDAKLCLEGTQGALRDGDAFLLCTDGLTRHVPDGEILGALRGGAPPARAVARLVEAALARGGDDNVTAVVVRRPAADGRTHGPGGRP